MTSLLRRLIGSDESDQRFEQIYHQWARDISDPRAEVRHVGLRGEISSIWLDHIKPKEASIDLTFPQVLEYIAQVGGTVASLSDIIGDNLDSSLAITKELGHSMDAPNISWRSGGLIGEGLVYLPDSRLLLVRREFNPILRNPGPAHAAETSWHELPSPPYGQRRFFAVPQEEVSMLEQLAKADANKAPEQRRVLLIDPTRLNKQLSDGGIKHYSENLDGRAGNPFVQFTAMPQDFQRVDIMRFLLGDKTDRAAELTQAATRSGAFFSDYSITVILKGSRSFHYIGSPGLIQHSGPPGQAFAQMLLRRFSPEFLPRLTMEEKSPYSQVIRPNNLVFWECGEYRANYHPLMVCAKFPEAALLRPRKDYSQSS